MEALQKRSTPGSWRTLGNEVRTQVALARGAPSGTEPSVATATGQEVEKTRTK